MSQSGSQERDLIIKRGYLSEKGSLLFEKRRWFVLKREANEYRLDIYKDEKAASKGEPTKGCIKMEQVVEVQRTNDKKQTFEILCPGTGQKFMANSEAEADDWVNVLHKLKSYRKEKLHPDPIGNLNQLQYYPNPEHPNVIVSPLHSVHGISNLPPHSPSHMQGVVTSSAADYEFMHSPHRHVQTRPGGIQIASQPIMMTSTSGDHPVRRQDSTGAYPSPSTNSSDSSPDLVGSTSTGSFDQSPATEEPSDFNKVRFRISLKESEKLQMVGPCDLVVSEDSIVLYSINSEQQLVSWPISSLRRYGLSPVCFSIDAGRGCYTGEGTFFFYTAQSKAIYNRVHRVAQQFKRPQQQQLAIEGTSPQPLPSPKTTSTGGHEIPAVTSSAASVYQTLQYDYKESPVSADHRQAHACMRTSSQPQRQHSTGNFFVCPPQTNPISIPTSMIPAQHIMIHSPTALHSPTTTMCPNCSLGFQQATPPSAVHFQRRPSSEEAHLSVPGMYYCNMADPGKKRYQNVTGPPNQ